MGRISKKLGNYGQKWAFIVLALLLASQSVVVESVAQAPTQNKALIDEFHQLISGKWARILVDASAAIEEKYIWAAIQQCILARNIDPGKSNRITAVSRTLSQRLGKIIIYQKIKKGLKRVDIGARQAILFPDLKTGKIHNGLNGFEISNTKGKVTLLFTKLKQGNGSVPVMVEGKALFLKCPKSTGSTK